MGEPKKAVVGQNWRDVKLYKINFCCRRDKLVFLDKVIHTTGLGSFSSKVGNMLSKVNLLRDVNIILTQDASQK